MLASGASKPRNFRAFSLRNSVEHRRVALVDLVLPLAALRQRTDVAHFLGIADRVRDQIVLDQPVDQPAVERVLGADRIAASRTSPAPCGRPRRAEAAASRLRPAAGRASLRACRASPTAAPRDNGRPSATSSPPPSAVPWIAATTGFVQSSMLSTTCGSIGSANALGVPNSVMSAPAKKVWPSQAITTALIAVVGLRLLDACDQALPDGMAKRVHRRIVRQDDQHVAVPLRRDRAGGGGLIFGDRSHDALRRTLERAAVGLPREGVADRQAAVSDQAWPLT